MKITSDQTVLRLIGDICSKHPILKAESDFTAIRNAGFNKLAYTIDAELNGMEILVEGRFITGTSILNLLKNGISLKTRIHNKLAAYWLYLYYGQQWTVATIEEKWKKEELFRQYRFWETYCSIIDQGTKSDYENISPGKTGLTDTVGQSFPTHHIYLSKLKEYVNGRFLLIIEGVTGSGKSNLIDSFITESSKDQTYSTILHPTISEGLAFENLMEDLQLFDLNATGSIGAKIDRLIEALESTNSLLVLDNFELADELSFIELLKKVSVRKGKARIILSHNRRFDYLFKRSSGVFQMNGFSFDDLNLFLRQRAIHLAEDQIRHLLKKTNGIQMAIEIFAEMSGSSYSSIEEKIKRLDRQTDFRTWIESILIELPPSCRQYLDILGLIRDSFTVEQALKIAADFEIENPQQVFDDLIDRFLISQVLVNGKYNYSLLRPITDYFKSQSLSTNLTSKHQYLAIFFWPSESLAKKKDFTIEELALVLKAIYHYQQIKNFRSSENYLDRILRYLKRVGLYQDIIENTSYEIEHNPRRNSWVDWEYIHALVITGQLEIAYQATINLLVHHFNSDQVLDETSDTGIAKTVKFIQLYTEILEQLGKPQLGLSLLLKTLSLFDVSDYDWSIRSQAVSIVAWLHYKNGDHQKAIDITNDLLKDFVLPDRAKAISLTRLGIINEQTGQSQSAITYLEEALGLLTNEPIEDQRAIAWCSFYLARAYQNVDELKKMESSLTTCLTISNSLLLCDQDYYSLITSFTINPKRKVLFQLHNAECERLKNRYSKIKLYLTPSKISQDFKNIDKLIIGKPESNFDYRTLMKPIDFTPKKIASRASQSAIRSAKNYPESVIKNVFSRKTTIRQVFGCHFYNKLITECLKETDNKKKILDTYIIPHLNFIIRSEDNNDKLKLHYARALEYAEDKEHALILLAAVAEKNWHFEYYTIKGNCSKDDFQVAYDLYKKALSLAFTAKQKGRVCNNIGNLILQWKRKDLYNEGKQMFEDAREYWKRDYKKSSFAICGRVLLEIEESSLTDVVDKTKALIDHFYINQKNVQEIIGQVSDPIKKKKLYAALKS